VKRTLIVACAAFAVAGCTSGKPFHYPLDTVLRFDDVQLKATHNSYHIETTDIPAWEYTMQPFNIQLDKQGVRSLEIDLNYLPTIDGSGNTIGHHFEVFHVDGADDGTVCQQFTDCLKQIKGWSDSYPGHLPIYLELEPKNGGTFVSSEADAFFKELEDEMLSVFPRQRIITPDEIRGTAATLPAALAHGWPTLDKLRGRVIFAFDDRTDVRMTYTHNLTNLDGRLSFVDSDPTDPFGAITIQNDPVADEPAIKTALAAHMLVRTRSDEDGDEARADDMSRFQTALADGAHFISTDFPAPVSGLKYYIDIPGGTPARCNPLTAPSDCTSLAIENPAFVGSAGK
jgi:hypothetical protein